MLEQQFGLKAKGTDVRTEVIAGITTFLTMAYIIFVNPQILSTTGMDASAVFVATCLAAALGSAIMALWANWPIGMAPGMGLNAFFAFTVVGTLGFTWQQALGAVFISGIIFLILSATGVRSWLISGIPASMRSAISGEMAARPLSTRESATRDTSSCCAVSVTVSPSAGNTSSRSVRPGWGGLNMRAIVFAPL